MPALFGPPSPPSLRLPSRAGSRGVAFVEHLVVVAFAMAVVATAAVLLARAYGASSACHAKAIASFALGCPAAPARLHAWAVGPRFAPGDAPVVCDRAGCRGTRCFAAETLVATPSGPHPIVDVRVGDDVFAADDDGNVSVRRVAGTKVTRDRPVLALGLEAGGLRDVVRVTAEHLFLVRGRGWQSAGDLALDDVVVDASGGDTGARVSSVTELAERTTVYNLEVEDLHTYFVGTVRALAHNDCTSTPLQLVSEALDLERAFAQLRERRAAEERRRTELPGTDFRRPPPSGRLVPPGGPVPVNPHAASDAAFEKLAGHRADWLRRAADALVAPTTSSADRKSLAAMILRVLTGDGPGEIDVSGKPLVSADAALQARVAAVDAPATFAARRALVAFANTPEGAALKPAVLVYLQSFVPPVQDPAKERADVTALIATLYRQELQAAIDDALATGLADAKDAGNLKRLVQLIFVREKARRDPAAWAAADMAAIDQAILVLEKDPFVKAQMAKLAAVAEAKAQARAKEVWAARIAYVQSAAFEEYLLLLPPSERGKVVADLIAPVAFIDPPLARDILAVLAARSIVREVDAMSREELQAQIGETLDALLGGGHDKDIKYSADVSKRLAKVIAAAAKSGKGQDMARAASAEIDALKLDAHTAGRVKTALKVILDLEKDRGAATTTSAVLGAWFLVGDAMKGKAWADKVAALESLATIAKTIDSADGMTKFVASLARNAGWALGDEGWLAVKAPDTSSAAVKAGKTTTAARWLLRAKLLGPAGDLLLMVAALEKVDKAALAANPEAALVNTGKFYFALAAFGAGGYLLAAGASAGPWAPVVWLVAAIGYVGLSLMEDSTEEALLRKLGVHRDQRNPPAPGPSADVDPAIMKYAAELATSRRHGHGPIGAEARLLLAGKTQITPYERFIVGTRGVRFYDDHFAAPGSCGKCH